MLEQEKDMEKKLTELEKRQTNLEQQLRNGLCGTTLILGICDIDEVVNVIEKRITKQEKKSGFISNSMKPYIISIVGVYIGYFGAKLVFTWLGVI